MTPQATVIGDVVRSRAAADRAALHRAVLLALGEVNETPGDLAPLTPLRITVGDEYQGTFASVGAALTATLRIRLALLPTFDVRQGIGWGAVRLLDETPRVEDGPGWWAARAAIERLEAGEDRAGVRRVRTAYECDPGRSDGPPPALVEAALLLRDDRVGALDARSLSVLRGLLIGGTQRRTAEELGVSASAVSQRVRHDGLAVLAAADDLMGGLR